MLPKVCRKVWGVIPARLASWQTRLSQALTAVYGPSAVVDGNT